MLLLVGGVALSACGDPSQTAPPLSSSNSTVLDTSSALPSAAPTTTVVDTSTTTSAAGTSTSAAASGPRHIDHDGLSSALPVAAQFGWLPAATVEEKDSDLTSRLGVGDCSGQSTVTPSREDSATNRLYSVDQEVLAGVTFYDVETIEDAQRFLSALDAIIGCASSPNPEVSFDAVVFTAQTQCDELRAIRTHQPVSETIDAWCRVGNLIAWIRLYPTGLIASEMDSSAPPPVAPTDGQAIEALVVVGQSLRTVWDAAG